MKTTLRISVDLDDTVAAFSQGYNDFFKTDIMQESNTIVTQNVYKLRNNKTFWESLNVLESLNFTPENYCTKRISNKLYTKNWLKHNNFPDRPVYQLYSQGKNKADLIKGRADVLIDDSISNFVQCNLAGVPCLLIDRPHNQDWGPIARIYNLDQEEIEDVYCLFKSTIFPYFKELIHAGR